MFFALSCNEAKKQDVVIVENEKKYDIDIDSLNRVAETSKSIYNFFEVSKDTLFASRHYGGLIYSINRGKTWSRTGDFFGFDDFVISDNGVLIGLGYWVGIHEPDYSKFYISRNFGQDWEKIEFETSKFFPVKIVSKFHKKLVVKTYSEGYFELVNDDYLNGWRKISFEPEENQDQNPIKYNDRNNRNVFLYTEKNEIIDTIAKLEFFTKIDTLISSRSYTYVNGVGFRPVQIGLDDYFAILNKNRKIKEFTYPGGYTYMIKTGLGRIFLYGGNGIFEVKKDELIQIY